MAMEESDGNMQSYSWADVEVAEVRNRSIDRTRSGHGGVSQPPLAPPL